MSWSTKEETKFVETFFVTKSYKVVQENFGYVFGAAKIHQKANFVLV